MCARLCVSVRVCLCIYVCVCVCVCVGVCVCVYVRVRVSLLATMDAHMCAYGYSLLESGMKTAL